MSGAAFATADAINAGSVASTDETAAPIPPSLAPGECHIWRIPIGSHAAWWEFLDEDELVRAERVAGVPLVQDTLVSSRGAQRLIGSHYLGLRPAAVDIDRICQHCGGPHGRPGYVGATFDYSVSHAGGWVFLAVAASGRVGVDIERIAGERDVDGLAGYALTTEEQRHFAALPPTPRLTSFFTSWVRKEAAMKLTGLGLQAPANRLDVSDSLLRVDRPLPRWPSAPIHLYDVSAAEGYVAALACTTRLTTLRNVILVTDSIPVVPMFS